MPIANADGRGAKACVMGVPDFLQNPAVKTWLGGVEPAWTLLDRTSFAALHRPPSPAAGAIRLASDLTNDEARQSAVVRNALILLRAAAQGPGLKMTATGNLSRGVVAEMCERFEWPDFDKAEAFQLHKVVNEPDFLPLYFVRHVAALANLLRPRKGYLKTSPAGRQVLDPPRVAALQAILFHLAFWHIDLGYFGPGLLHGWPQRDAGVVLWSLSIAAGDWQSPERLTRLCTIPIDDVLGTTWDRASYAMEARILHPCNGSGCSSTGRTTSRETVSKSITSIARPRCSTASCPSTCNSRARARRVTDAALRARACLTGRGGGPRAHAGASRPMGRWRQYD